MFKSYRLLLCDFPYCFSYICLNVFTLIYVCFFPPSLSVNSDVTQLKKELNDLVDAIVENFFEPEKNKLQPKAE